MKTYKEDKSVAICKSRKRKLQQTNLRPFLLRPNGAGDWSLSIIRTYYTHDCAMEFAAKKLSVGANWVADIIHAMLGDFPQMRLKDILNDVRRDQHAAVSYHTTMRPRFICDELTNGTIFPAYRALPSELATIGHQNPGSHILYRAEHGLSHRCFIAYAASIRGFKYCRPLIAIDACHLKGHFRSQIFSAVTR